MHVTIDDFTVRQGGPVYIIAEMSANHNQDFDQAVTILKEAKKAGADAVKLQTYTPDTITIDCRNQYFQISEGTLWEGRNLYDLYQEAYTPWAWQPRLKAIADDIGLDLFSSPFDPRAVSFLEEMNVPAYKIASFEIVDLPLVRCIARTGKPIILSTGMASLHEIDEAVEAIRGEGNQQIILLKCTSAYPAPPEEMNLRTIPHLHERFQVPAGLSDHTLGSEVAIAAVATGASVIEKHFTLSREKPGPDSVFSLEPAEFRQMVSAIRTVEKAMGKVSYQLTEKQSRSRAFRRSLFAVQPIRKGETFTRENVRSIRPADGLPPKYLDKIVGRTAGREIAYGTPLAWELVE